MKAKTYRITKINGSKTYHNEGTLSELIQSFSYTLQAGKSWEKEKGRSKINTQPKTIKALVDNLNKSVNNSAANGFSGTHYEWETIEQDEVLAEFLKMRREIVREIEAEAKGG
jgi:hypothetical protein